MIVVYVSSLIREPFLDSPIVDFILGLIEIGRGFLLEIVADWKINRSSSNFSQLMMQASEFARLKFRVYYLMLAHWELKLGI